MSEIPVATNDEQLHDKEQVVHAQSLIKEALMEGLARPSELRSLQNDFRGILHTDASQFYGSSARLHALSITDPNKVLMDSYGLMPHYDTLINELDKAIEECAQSDIAYLNKLVEHNTQFYTCIVSDDVNAVVERFVGIGDGVGAIVDGELYNGAIQDVVFKDITHQ